jgi:hypothetical protein
VQLIADKEAKTLTLIDRGCGMSKEDLINHLGARRKPTGPERLRGLGMVGVKGWSGWVQAGGVRVGGGGW